MTTVDTLTDDQIRDWMDRAERDLDMEQQWWSMNSHLGGPVSRETHNERVRSCRETITTCRAALHRSQSSWLKLARQQARERIASAISAQQAQVTPDTITDAQIAELWEIAKRDDNTRLATDCAGALLPGNGRSATRDLLRVRCAAAWNRRTP